MPLIQKPSRALAVQFGTFAAVGVVNTAISFSTYAAGTRLGHLDPLVANIVAFAIAVTASFFLNRRFTFRGHTGRLHHQYGKFFLVNLVGLGLSETIIAVVHKAWGVNDILAFGIAVVVVLFWNFGANRAWAFRPTNLPPA